MAINGQQPERLGIHVLSEFEFCPRAGLITFHEESDDIGMDRSIGRLDYMPMYDLQEIVDEIRLLAKNLKIEITGLSILSVVLLLVCFFLKPIVITATILIWITGLVFFVRGRIPLVRRLGNLYKSHKDFVDISKRMPNLDDKSEEELDWRQVIRFGFDLTKLPQKLFVDELGIAGTPWKILLRQDMCIPVFRCPPTKPKDERATHPSNWLYQQHYIRMAAYCAAIENCTKYRAPFGLILFSGGYRVFAIKMDDATTEALRESLQKARQTLQAFRNGQNIPPPTQLCKNCPLGFPRSYVYDDTIVKKNGEKVEPKFWIRGGERLHSRCGDFFSWTPHHKKYLEMDLLDDDKGDG